MTEYLIDIVHRLGRLIETEVWDCAREFYQELLSDGIAKHDASEQAHQQEIHAQRDVAVAMALHGIVWSSGHLYPVAADPSWVPA